MQHLRGRGDRRAQLADHDAGGHVGEPGGVLERKPGGERGGGHRGHGIAGARDVEDLARLGRQT